jgi:hypothetical protein
VAPPRRGHRAGLLGAAAQAAGCSFLRPAALLGYSEKARDKGAGRHCMSDHPQERPEGDRTGWCADRAAASIGRLALSESVPQYLYALFWRAASGLTAHQHF